MQRGEPAPRRSLVDVGSGFHQDLRHLAAIGLGRAMQRSYTTLQKSEKTKRCNEAQARITTAVIELTCRSVEDTLLAAP